jgi:hypothetical protein
LKTAATRAALLRPRHLPRCRHRDTYCDGPRGRDQQHPLPPHTRLETIQSESKERDKTEQLMLCHAYEYTIRIGSQKDTCLHTHAHSLTEERRVPPWRSINGASRSNVAALSAQPCSAIQRSWGRSAAAVSSPQMRTAILKPVGSTRMSSRQASLGLSAATAEFDSILGAVWTCLGGTSRGLCAPMQLTLCAPMQLARDLPPAHRYVGAKQSTAAADSTRAAAARMCRLSLEGMWVRGSPRVRGSHRVG